jgi:hypothetical protein
MFQVFQKAPFQAPQHGEGMWPPLVYGIDVLGIFAGIVATFALLFVAWMILPLILH